MTLKTSIIKAGGSSFGNFQRKIVIDSNKVLHCIYSRNEGGMSNIFHSYSSDGTNWTEEAVTTDTENYNTSPAIAIDSLDNLHIVFLKGDLFITGWCDTVVYGKYDGNSWTLTEIVNFPGWYSGLDYHVAYQYYPSIAVDSNNYIHLVWSGINKDNSQKYYRQIRYTKYTDSWSAVIDFTSEPYSQRAPSIATDSKDNIHITWLGTNGSPTSCMRYIKYDGSWSSIVDIDTTTSFSFTTDFPCIAVDSNDYLYVVYAGSEESVYNIYLTKFTTSWQAPEKIFANEFPYVGDPEYPVVAVDANDKIHVLFDDGYGIKYMYYDSSWSDLQTLTDGASDEYPNILWAKNNVPTKVQFIWTGADLYYSEIRKKLHVMGYF